MRLSRTGEDLSACNAPLTRRPSHAPEGMQQQAHLHTHCQDVLQACLLPRSPHSEWREAKKQVKTVVAVQTLRRRESAVPTPSASFSLKRPFAPARSSKRPLWGSMGRHGKKQLPSALERQASPHAPCRLLVARVTPRAPTSLTAPLVGGHVLFSSLPLKQEGRVKGENIWLS